LFCFSFAFAFASLLYGYKSAFILTLAFIIPDVLFLFNTAKFLKQDYLVIEDRNSYPKAFLEENVIKGQSWTLFTPDVYVSAFLNLSKNVIV
jgi:hypothetical protein